MYRVMIVDDEQWALVGMRKFLERGGGRLQIIHETTNPLDALDNILRLQPDLVFTDIRMPEINGLELLDRAHQAGSKAEFVIISGFSEFSYAQQALRGGALDYLLKPLDTANAKEILDKLIAQLDAKHQSDDLTLFGQLNAEQDNPRALLQPRLPMPIMPCWQAVTLLLDKEHTVIAPLPLPEDCQSLQMQLGPHKAICLINSQQPRQEAIFSAMASLPGLVSCGMSPVAKESEPIAHLMRLCEVAVFDSFLHPEEKVFTFHAPQPSKVLKIWKQLSSELRSSQTESLKRYLQRLPELFREQTLTANDALNLWNLIAENLHEYRPTTDALSDITPLRLHTLVDKFGSFSAMCQYLIVQLADQQIVRDGSANQHFRRLLRYVETHYMDSLNLQELCDQYFINVSYCCELFRRETHSTFTQYITRLRMEHARELLTTTSLPLKDICDRVGYNDYLYFDKVFKKNVGCTPSEYRRSREGVKA